MKTGLALVGVLAAVSAWAQAPAQVADLALWRLDCGTAVKPTVLVERFSDTFAYPTDKTLTFTYSCYVIKHGNEYMVWDTGFAPGSNPNAPRVSLADQLKQLNATPEQVKYVGISHFHADHTGQLGPLVNATLLIGKGDWDGVNAGFKEWIGTSRKVEPLTLDKDVFGDGTVVVLRAPGHTPGHSALLVRLKGMGPVILTGDLAHFRENWDSDGVPAFNYDRAQTVATLERVKKIAANLKATVVIQHDARDISKLPAFPKAAN